MNVCLRPLLALAFVLCCSAVSATEQDCPTGDGNFANTYANAAPFEAAIAREASSQPIAARLTGLTVPHHLVASDLIARGFRAAEGSDYDRIIVMSPDHFRRSGAAFSTTRRGFDTVLGPVQTDRAGAKALVDAGADESCLFSAEHGILALLPFVRHSFPDTPIVPVAISVKATRPDWDRLADALAPLLGARTLVVQSIDFSHYHPAEIARQFDQQTLNLIAAGSLDGIAGLTQPDHMDSVGGLYLQTKLQREVHNSAPIVIASENQQAYSSVRLKETTGYFVIAHGPFAGRSAGNIAGGALVYFAGDTFFGRAMTPALADADATERVAAAVLDRTFGHPLVANLEGVILPNVPEAMPHMTLAMPEDLTTGWLKRLNVAAVSLANNHSMDLGDAGLTETTQALERAGIPLLRQGETMMLGPLKLVGLTDIDSNGPPFTDLVDADLLARVHEPDPGRPVVALMHWGREYVASPSDREIWLADEIRLAGASVIVGGHPHVASESLVALGGGDALMAYSLGNFLFDQSASRSSGALVEMRVFPQGTVFVRQIELPNLFELARSQ